jgi:AraC-like DNA-binding protein
VGFVSKAGLFRAFHRMFGCTPGAVACRAADQRFRNHKERKSNCSSIEVQSGNA